MKLTPCTTTYRPLTPAEGARRWREGVSDKANWGRTAMIGQEVRNGLPAFKPYRWHGQNLGELRARLDAEYEAAP